jgi:hypothetical protein
MAIIACGRSSWSLPGSDCGSSRTARWRNGFARARVGGAKARAAKIMIVALARKLLIALWRFVKDGVIPEGAAMKA